jgi:hypothetical protein
MSNFGKWSSRNVPHKGWICNHTEDLGEPSQTCEMCERETIRYVHYMFHPQYKDELQCGCVCAGNMAEDLVGAENRERLLKNKTGKRKRWGKLKSWHRSQKGNMTITRDGYRCTVFKYEQLFKGLVTDLQKNETIFSKRTYIDEERTKFALFDYVEFLKSLKLK